MDKTIPTPQKKHTEKFRVPHAFEKKLGLWLDRMGEAEYANNVPKARRLALYGAVLVEKGGGIFFTENLGNQEVEAGDIMLVFPDIGCYYHPFETWFSRWFIWDGPSADTLIHLGYFSPNWPVVRGRAQIFHKSWEQLRELLDREDRTAILRRKAVLLDFLSELVRPPKSTSPDERPLAHHNAVESVITFMKENYHRAISINALATQMQLSASYFRKVFRDYTGMSPGELLAEIRVTRAKELLLDGKPIKEASRDTGFADPLYFMRFFKKRTGLTAIQFIKKGG